MGCVPNYPVTQAEACGYKDFCLVMVIIIIGTWVLIIFHGNLHDNKWRSSFICMTAWLKIYMKS